MGKINLCEGISVADTTQRSNCITYSGYESIYQYYLSSLSGYQFANHEISLLPTVLYIFHYRQ
jgi:hypothetical protein